MSFISLLLVVLLPLATPDSPGAVPREQEVQGSRLIRLARSVTGDERVRIPLLVATDADGRVVAFGSGGSEAELARLVHRARTERGIEPFVDLAMRAGIGLAPSPGSPAVFALTMPKACPPCARLTPHLAEAARTHPDVRFLSLSAYPRAAAGR